MYFFLKMIIPTNKKDFRLIFVSKMCDDRKVASWVGLTSEHIKILQDYQNSILRKVLAGPQQDTPKDNTKGMKEMDGSMMLMYLRIK